MPLSVWAINASAKEPVVESISFQDPTITNTAVKSIRMQTRKQGGNLPIPNGLGSKRGELERKRDAQRRPQNRCGEKAPAPDDGNFQCCLLRSQRAALKKLILESARSRGGEEKPIDFSCAGTPEEFRKLCAQSHVEIQLEFPIIKVVGYPLSSGKQ
jgi:hypothetical protein